MLLSSRGFGPLDGPRGNSGFGSCRRASHWGTMSFLVMLDDDPEEAGRDLAQADSDLSVRTDPPPAAGGAHPRLKFGRFELDPHAGLLTRDGVPVKLQPQPFKLLVLLARRAGDVVTREEIR